MYAHDEAKGMTPPQALAYAVAAWEQYLDQRIDSRILEQVHRACCWPLETNLEELSLMILYEMKGW